MLFIVSSSWPHILGLIIFGIVALMKTRFLLSSHHLNVLMILSPDQVSHVFWSDYPVYANFVWVLCKMGERLSLNMTKFSDNHSHVHLI